MRQTSPGRKRKTGKDKITYRGERGGEKTGKACGNHRLGGNKRQDKTFQYVFGPVFLSFFFGLSFFLSFSGKFQYIFWSCGKLQCGILTKLYWNVKYWTLHLVLKCLILCWNVSYWNCTEMSQIELYTLCSVWVCTWVFPKRECFMFLKVGTGARLFDRRDVREQASNALY